MRSLADIRHDLTLLDEDAHQFLHSEDMRHVARSALEIATELLEELESLMVSQ